MRIMPAIVASAVAVGLAVTAATAAPRPVAEAPVAGGLITDPTHPRRLRYFRGGPAFIAAVGAPEGSVHRGTRSATGPQSGGDQQAIINELIARRINGLDVIGFNDRRYGGDGETTEVDGRTVA